MTLYLCPNHERTIEHFKHKKKMFGKHINNLKWFKPTKICCPLFVYLSVFMFKSHLLKRLKKQSVETTWLCFEPKRQGVYLPVLHSHTEFTENVTLRSDLSNILFLIPLLAIFRNLVMIDAVCFFGVLATVTIKACTTHFLSINTIWIHHVYSKQIHQRRQPFDYPDMFFSKHFPSSVIN